MLKTAYFDLNGLWLALNLEENVPRNQENSSYTHIAFSIEDEDFEDIALKLKDLNVHILPSRERNEMDKKSIYFTDPEGHKFELHTGNLEDRLFYYRETKPNMIFFEN